MRTPEQIGNLRNVLHRLIGIYAIFLTDYQIDAWANALQRHINSLEYEWAIKIRTEDDIEKSWSDINFESKFPVCSFEKISRKCYELIEKYPKIVSIQICNGNDHLDEHIFDRKQL